MVCPLTKGVYKMDNEKLKELLSNLTLEDLKKFISFAKTLSKKEPAFVHHPKDC